MMAQPRLPTQRQLKYAKVAGSCVATFFHTLDRNHDGFVSLDDLHAFVAKHHVTFEFDHFNPDQPQTTMPPTLLEQTRQVIEAMYFDALSLRAPTMYAKSVRLGATKQDVGDTLALEDVKTAFLLRFQKIQRVSGQSETHVIYASKYRSQWLTLLLKIVLQPFEPIPNEKAPIGVHAPAVHSMFEREAAHSQQLQTIKRNAREAAPIGPESDFHPTTYLHHPPTAISPAASYSFTQPQIKVETLSGQYLQQRADTERKTQDELEKTFSAKKTKLVAMARAIEARAQTLQAGLDRIEKEENEFEATQISWSRHARTNSSLQKFNPDEFQQQPASSPPSPPPQVISPSSDNGTSPQPTQIRALGETLNAPRLSFISFRTREEFDTRLQAEQLKSDSLDYKKNSSAALKEAKSEEDLLAKALASQLSGAKKPSKYDNETPTERVNRMLKEARQSHSTSARFKPQSKSLLSATTQLGHPRWINANAPADPSVRRPKTAEVTYDDQGRPIKPHRRAALTERLSNHPGVVLYPDQRREWDNSQAELLSQSTDRALERFDIPDPLDTLLAPYVPEFKARPPTDALKEALAVTPSTTKTSRRLDRERESAGAKGSVASFDFQTSDIRDANPPKGKPQFILDFHLPSTQDERLSASRELSVFKTTGEKPSWENGQVHSLSDLNNRFKPSNTGLDQMLNRDASIGDISLLKPGSFQLSQLLARKRLEESRAPFRLDFRRERERHDAKYISEAHVIARDGGLTTAAEDERWRQYQLGIGLNLKSANQTPEEKAKELHQHTRGKIVHTNHLAPGSHQPRHQTEFTTLIGSHNPLTSSPTYSYPPLHQSEYEQYMRDMGHEDQLKKQQADEKRRTQFANLKPSERRKLKEVEEKEAVYQRFPFETLYPPKENKNKK